MVTINIAVMMCHVNRTQRAIDWYDIGRVPFGVGGRQVARD